MDGISISCKECGEIFIVCRSCYRGHRYCSNQCRLMGYRESNTKAQKKYQKTFKGRLNHSKRQMRYRAKHKIVTHQTSIKLKTNIEKTPTIKNKCLGCNQSITRTFKSFEQLKLIRSYYEKT